MEENKKDKPVSEGIIWLPESNDQELLDITKSPEEKLFYVFYQDMFGYDTYKACVGRFNCVRYIEYLTEVIEHIDMKDVMICPEMIVINRHTNKYMIAIMDPNSDDCMNAVQFYRHAIDNYYMDAPDTIDIFDYTDLSYEDIYHEDPTVSLASESGDPPISSETVAAYAQAISFIGTPECIAKLTEGMDIDNQPINAIPVRSISNPTPTVPLVDRSGHAEDLFPAVVDDGSVFGLISSEDAKSAFEGS